MAFAYFGLYADAMVHGRVWFRKPKWPPYVTWWVDGDHAPDWTEAVERHEHLHDHGSAEYAFNFKQPFDASGRKTTIDRDKVKVFADHYA